MTNHQKKAYLKQYLQCEKAQKEIEEEIAEMRLSFMPSVKLDDMPHGHHISDLSDYAIRMDKLFNQLKKALDKKIAVRYAIRHSIEQMDNETEKLVLVLAYIRGMKFIDIAQEMGYSEGRVWHLHGEALSHFEPWPENKWEY